jgi:hypothetical protein
LPAAYAATLLRSAFRLSGVSSHTYRRCGLCCSGVRLLYGSSPRNRTSNAHFASAYQSDIAGQPVKFGYQERSLALAGRFQHLRQFRPVGALPVSTSTNDATMPRRMQAREGLDGAPLGFQSKAAFPLADDVEDLSI